MEHWVQRINVFIFRVTGLIENLGLKKVVLSVVSFTSFSSTFWTFLLIFRKTPKNLPVTPKTERPPIDASPGSSPLLSASPLNTPLNRTPVRKISRPSSAESRHDKDNGSDGSNVSSGATTPRLQHRDLAALQSMSDSESILSKDLSRNSYSSTFPNLEFLQEVTEGLENMEDETNTVKETLLHLQNLVSLFCYCGPMQCQYFLLFEKRKN